MPSSHAAVTSKHITPSRYRLPRPWVANAINSNSLPALLIVLPIVLPSLLTGCSGDRLSSTNRPLDPAPSSGSSNPADRPAPASIASGKTVAIVADTAISQGDILPLLAEAAGGRVLDELALATVVQQECARRSVRVTSSMIDDERAMLARQLAISAGLPESDGAVLVQSVRQSRSLGDRRFRLLLETNAGLRALVRNDPQQAISITPADIQTAYDLKHGPRINTRLILVRSREQAQQAAQLLAAGQTFESVAATLSIDPSGIRGGQIDPVSPADSNFPVAIRRSLQALTPGQISEPIAVEWSPTTGSEAGLAIVKSEGSFTRPGAPAIESVTSTLESEVRLVRERARMERLGRQLVRSAGVSVIDPALSWSWEQYRSPDTR